jgi:hypothetical protein
VYDFFAQAAKNVFCAQEKKVFSTSVASAKIFSLVQKDIFLHIMLIFRILIEYF